MTLRKVVEYPDPILKQVAKEVAAVSADVIAIIDDMFETMYAEKGAGLAANQIGVDLQIFVMDMTDDRSGAREYLGLAGGPARFIPDFTSPVLLGIPTTS